MRNIINMIGGFLLSTITYLFGGFDLALTSFIMLMVLDYTTGLASAFKNKKVSSKVGATGLIKKFLYLCIICVVTIIDRNLGDSGLVRLPVIYGFCTNEIISIFENVSKYGIKMPDIIINSLEQLKNKK